MRIGIIVNPVSGGGRAERHAEAVLAAIRGQHLATDMVRTRGRGDGARLAESLARSGVDLIIAFGGDGTLGEVADGLLRLSPELLPGRPELGFLAAGTGSDFRRNFSFSSDPARAALQLLALPARPVDAGRVTFALPGGGEGQRHFINIASLGITGEIVTAVNRAKLEKNRSGGLVYLLHTLSALMRFRFPAVAVRVDGEPPVEARVAAVAIANGAWFGGGMKIAPDARIDDGFLDAVIVRARNRPTLIANLARVYGGLHRTHPDVTIRRARTVEVRPADPGDVIPLEFDGEDLGCLPARYEILPGALMLRG